MAALGARPTLTPPTALPEGRVREPTGPPPASSRPSRAQSSETPGAASLALPPAGPEAVASLLSLVPTFQTPV